MSAVDEWETALQAPLSKNRKSEEKRAFLLLSHGFTLPLHVQKMLQRKRLQ